MSRVELEGSAKRPESRPNTGTSVKQKQEQVGEQVESGTVKEEVMASKVETNVKNLANPTVLRPLIRPVRPSSAGGKLQTHSSYSKPLIEPPRAGLLPPIEAVEKKESLARRPVTAHAGSSGRPTLGAITTPEEGEVKGEKREKHSEEETPAVPALPRQRRPTVTNATATEIGRILGLHKSQMVQRQAGDLLKGRVCFCCK